MINLIDTIGQKFKNRLNIINESDVIAKNKINSFCQDLNGFNLKYPFIVFQYLVEIIAKGAIETTQLVKQTRKKMR